MTNPHISAQPQTQLWCGLPVWQHPQWPSSWFGSSTPSQLFHYSRRFNSVEGNTTFYSLPALTLVKKWYQQTPEHFKFTFKFHQQISHYSGLSAHCPELTRQLSLMEALEDKLGLMLLQLPKSFAPDALPKLQTFLTLLPNWLTVAVEVRHPAFFEKGEAEKTLNRLLIENKCNRMIMDTRALFSGPVTSPLLAEVRKKKPRVPVNVIATASNPVVRFVGNDNESDNIQRLTDWVKKVHQWLREGKQPYLFFHRPDNQLAPELAQLFYQQYQREFGQALVIGQQNATSNNQTSLF